MDRFFCDSLPPGLALAGVVVVRGRERPVVGFDHWMVFLLAYGEEKGNNFWIKI